MQFGLAVGGFVEEELVGELLEGMLREVHLLVGLPFLGRREERVNHKFEGFFNEIRD